MTLPPSVGRQDIDRGWAQVASAVDSLLREPTERWVGAGATAADLLVFAARLYAYSVEEVEGGRLSVGHDENSTPELTATEACIGCTSLLERVGLGAFELGMWKMASGLVE